MGDWGTDQHRVPASIIGRHGEPAGDGLRDALVMAKRLDTGKVFGPVAARSIFYEAGAYDYTEPGRTAEDLWTETENYLPRAASDLEAIARRHLSGHTTRTDAEDAGCSTRRRSSPDMRLT